ncbi:MAG: FAD:protein FMN transferase [Firmicutes bacterium]|nr:FAD:protein FMN transferase [Bacillota bacterium]
MNKCLKYIISIFIINLLIIGFIYKKNKQELYTTNLFYMDTYINIKFYSNNEKNAIKALEEAENLYETYHNLTDRYNSSSELYLVNHTFSELEIDERLYNLIDYSKNWHSKSNGLFNINMGDVIDIWKKYRDSGTGIPTKEELKVNIDINSFTLLENNTILNKNANIDLGGIVKGYVTNLVGEAFSKLGIEDYIINAGGNVLVGKKAKGKYKIGIESPINTGEIYQVVTGNNISVVTSGSYERFYEYNGKMYHHIINPNTLYPSGFMKSVTVVCEDSALADILSTTLFLMPIEDGKNYLKQFENVEAVWFDNNNNIIKSEGFNKYE